MENVTKRVGLNAPPTLRFPFKFACALGLFGITYTTFNTQFVEALPTAIMKPLSGGGARGMMVESWGENASQINSFVGKLTSTLQGSTETTFYVLAVYFGSVGIRNTRYAVVAGLFADLVGIIAAIAIAYFFWG